MIQHIYGNLHKLEIPLLRNLQKAVGTYIVMDRNASRHFDEGKYDREGISETDREPSIDSDPFWHFDEGKYDREGISETNREPSMDSDPFWHFDEGSLDDGGKNHLW